MSDETEVFTVRIPVHIEVEAPRGDGTKAHERAMGCLEWYLARPGVPLKYQVDIGIGDDEDHEVMDEDGDDVEWGE